MQYFGSIQNLDIFLKFGGISPSAKVWDVDLTLEVPRTARATDSSKCSPFWNFMLGHYNGLLEVMEGLSRSTACATAQAFHTDGVNCKDSICNNPKLILGSYVKRPK